jgi:DNA 3'-phosphatase
MNNRLADIFQELAKEFSGEKYRKRAYEIAAESIRNHNKPILSGDQAQREIKGVGKSIASKIDEIIQTGKLQLLEDRPDEVKNKQTVLKEFQNIHGVGAVTAGKWYNMGYHTFESLSRLYPQMTDAQKLGYYYYHQFKLRIPRAEMVQIHQTIDSFWKPLEVVYEIAGSYRRGESDSGDIDILVKRTNSVGSISTLLEPLLAVGLIVGNLALGDTKYMGILKLGENMNARRIDIRLVEGEVWSYALLYFTGSKELNVIMRTEALKRNLTMNEYGMVDRDGKQYPANTEEDIFTYLGMTYLPPTQRSLTNMDQVIPNMEQVIPNPVIPKKLTGTWYRPTQSLLLYMSDDFRSTGHMACFDLDWTLIRPYKKAFPIDADDLQLLPNRKETLKNLIDRGFTLIVFTNQKSSGKRVEIIFQRLNNFISMINLPLILMASLEDDQYRKPNIGMYQTLQQMIPGIITSFYCGDAAGRSSDFSDSDKMFALNNQITFYLPEQLFKSIERLKPESTGPVEEIDLPTTKVMVLFVGMPGSGKTTYYHQNLQPLEYVHANQDLLGTKAKVLKVVSDSMQHGLNVCVDATNPRQQRRVEFYNLAQSNDYNIVVIYFVRNGVGYNKLRDKPVPTVGYNMYYKYLVEPTPFNTPGSLYQVG